MNSYRIFSESMHEPQSHSHLNEILDYLSKEGYFSEPDQETPESLYNDWHSYEEEYLRY